MAYLDDIPWGPEELRIPTHQTSLMLRLFWLPVKQGRTKAIYLKRLIKTA
jgi:hypothetical protein